MKQIAIAALSQLWNTKPCSCIWAYFVVFSILTFVGNLASKPKYFWTALLPFSFSTKAVAEALHSPCPTQSHGLGGAGLTMPNPVSRKYVTLSRLLIYSFVIWDTKVPLFSCHHYDFQTHVFQLEVFFGSVSLMHLTALRTDNLSFMFLICFNISQHKNR